MRNAYGKAPKKISTTWMRRWQQRVANVALPLRSYNVFHALRDQQIAQHGDDYGMANDPRKAMQYGGYYASLVPQMPKSQELDTIHTRVMDQTRDQMMAKSSDPFAVAMMEPKQGVASPAQLMSPAMGPKMAAFGAKTPYMHGTPAPAGHDMAGISYGINPNTGRGGNIDQLQPSLAQTLGSGLLSAQQLSNASYSNVYSLLHMTQGNESDKRVAAFLLQRMILEGYVRGVDVYRQLKDAGGLNYGMGSPRCGYSCGGHDGRRPFVDMNSNGYGSDVAFLNVFYQEVGHALGQMNHTRGLMAGSYQYSDLTGMTLRNYSTWLDYYFQDVGKNRFRPGTMGTPLNNTQVQDWLRQNPGAIPPADGTTVPPGGPPPPGTPPNVVVNNPPDNVTVNPRTFVNVYDINPVNISPAGAEPTPMGSSTGPTSTPDSAHNTPVAGVLPNMDGMTKGFASGLQSAMSQASPMIGNLAGALAKFKSGS